MEFEGIWLLQFGKQKKNRDRIIFSYLRFFNGFDTNHFSPQKAQTENKNLSLVLLKRLRLSAKGYSNCNYQLNSLNMVAAQPQTVEMKEKGKNLPEILTHTLYQVELDDLHISSSSCRVKDSKILIKKFKT